MDKIGVSILICTYNAEHTIINTLNSCLSQSYQNFEILIHDDMSVDNTLLAIKSINDQRIKIINSGKKLGPYGGLNFLLEIAKGKYIAIQDHDDIWHSDKLKTQVNFLDDNIYYVGCGTKTLMYYESDTRGFEYYLGESSSYAIHPSLIFRNDRKSRYPNNIYMNDALFQKNILCKGKKLIYNINQTLTLHRIKKGGSNYSYKWFVVNKKNILTLFGLHGWWYGMAAFLREIMRKIIYPFLGYIGGEKYIDKIERIPFVLLQNHISKYDKSKLAKMGFYL